MNSGLILQLGLFLDRRPSSGSLRYLFVQVIVLSTAHIAVVSLPLRTFHPFCDSFAFFLECLNLGFFRVKLTL